MIKILLPLILFSFTVFATESEDAKRDFERATQLLSEGKEEQALVSFGDFLRRYPDSQQADEAQFFLGEVYFRKKQYFEALKEFRRTQIKNGVDPETMGQATLRAGECWQMLGNTTYARIEWESILRKFDGKKIAEQAKDKLGSLKSGQ